MLVSEVTVIDQPLSTTFPGANARLPIESQVLDQLDILHPRSLSNVPLSCLTLPHLGGFARMAQATCLLDQVLTGVKSSDINSTLPQFDRLDVSIQSLLSLVMPRCQEEPGVYCAAINIAIRSVPQYKFHPFYASHITIPHYKYLARYYHG